MLNEIMTLDQRETEIITEQELRDIYYNPSKGYQSAKKLYQKAKEKGLGISRKMVKEWLKTQDTYTRYKPIVRKHKHLKSLVKNLEDQMQMDLVDMGKYGSKNKGYRWVLTAIEILSRFAFTIPVYSRDTKNMTKAVNILLDSFKKRFGRYPNIVQFDEGKEFYNVGVRELLRSHDIDYFSMQSNKKAAILERFNRTLKTMMWKYFYSKGFTERLTKNYYNTKHTSIHIKPKDVNKTNESMVWVTLYGSPSRNLPLPKFRVGDTVRVSKYKSVFAKEYEANFTEEILKLGRFLEGILPHTNWRITKVNLSSESSTKKNYRR